MTKRLGGFIRDILLGRVGRAPAAGSAGTGERRACERFDFSVTVPFRVPGDRAAADAAALCLRNLSASGVGLTHTRHIPPGTDLILLLPIEDDGVIDDGDREPMADRAAAGDGRDDSRREVACRVTRCVESAPGVFVIGAVFVHRLVGDWPDDDRAAANQQLTEAEICRIREHILDG